MPASPELEIGIRRSEAGGFSVELRLRRDDGEPTPRKGAAAVDLNALDQSTPEDYGRVLTGQIFQAPDLAAAFREAFVAAQVDGQCLRVRLLIDRDAAQLHGLKWELLETPGDDAPARRPISTHQQVYFSRFLSSFDWRPLQLRRQGKGLDVLVAVASPSNLNEWGAAPIDADAEIERARSHLGAIPPPSLAQGTDKLGKPLGEVRPAGPVTVDAVRGPDTLGQVVSRLRARSYDVLYLVCHGKRVQQISSDAVLPEETRLYLEDDKGRVTATSGGEVVLRLSELTNRPRLVVLASCQSAGAADESGAAETGALAAVGPKLAEAGIAAVLAMQARLSMETAAKFFPAFFEELARHGQVDQAVAAARGQVRDRQDFWVPVLFTRISHGRIWYVPGFATRTGETFDGWDALIKQLQDNLKGKTGCTPVLGTGLLEGLVGSSREIAQRWADDTHFAMAPHQREDLPQVSQYLAVTQGLAYPSKALEDRLRAELLRRFPDLDASPAVEIDEALNAGRAHLTYEPHAVLAGLPFPIYVSTNPDDQLRRALVAAGRSPRVELFRWHTRPECEWPEPVCEPPPGSNVPKFEPSLAQPLVYLLFGQLQDPDTLVLTEDDHFDFLIGSTLRGKLAPSVVKAALARSALLFLGFRLEEWDFRVLFRSILAQGDRQELSNRFPHIAAQITPEEGRLIDTARARNYLQKSFWNARISLYWGTVDDFIHELYERAVKAGLWQKPPGNTP